VEAPYQEALLRLISNTFARSINFGLQIIGTLLHINYEAQCGKGACRKKENMLA
jgi:hypothetical protein